MTDSRNFNVSNLNLNGLTHAVTEWFEFQNYQVQDLQLSNGDKVIQARQGGWRNMLGLSSALNIVLRHQDNTLTVEIGAGKWADKAVVGAVSMFVLWPLAFTAAYGAWQQQKLPQRTFDFIQQYIYQG